jgi:hypothetical protein
MLVSWISGLHRMVLVLSLEVYRFHLLQGRHLRLYRFLIWTLLLLLPEFLLLLHPE